jgi:hypothetical protein
MEQSIGHYTEPSMNTATIYPLKPRSGLLQPYRGILKLVGLYGDALMGGMI